MRISRLALFFTILSLSMPLLAVADAVSDQKAALQAQLNQLNKEIVQTQSQLADQQKQRTSLERDVAILDSKIQEAQLEIKARDLTIKQITQGIGEKQLGISQVDDQVAAGEQSIAQMLRETHMSDDLSLAEIALNGSMTDVMRELDDFQSIQKSLAAAFDQMKSVRQDLNDRKTALEDQQQEEQDLRQIQVLQQQTLKQNEKDKQDLIKAAKGQESVYQKIIASKQKSADQIRAALFSLRDTKATSFGDMYSYAKEAGAKTGVRPALILGILAEESNLGQNVGSGNWKVDMNPTRDAPVFQEICAQLGLNPDTQPVSKKPWYGWGGAMGPAQFIPSTWKQYEDRISAMANEDPPNPWNPRTATFATAILMMDNGADAQTPAAERLAALRYLAGWNNASKSAYSFYGNDVMDLAAKFQSQIDILGG